jgi:hypothetical protein
MLVSDPPLTRPALEMVRLSKRFGETVAADQIELVVPRVRSSGWSVRMALPTHCPNGAAAIRSISAMNRRAAADSCCRG